MTSSSAESAAAQGYASNSTIETQLAHRSIRSFTDEPLAEDVIRTLFTVASRTATCGFYQQFTIIRVSDAQLRNQLEVSMKQRVIAEHQGELFVFVADLHRNAKIREEAGADLEPLGRMSVFMESLEDTLLAAQNVVVAAESLGLGTVYLGALGTDPAKVIELLKLPKYTYPVLGLLIGHPAKDPIIKPRLPLDYVTAVDSYPQLDNVTESLAGYDEEVRDYYIARSGKCTMGSFTDRVRDKLGTGRSERSSMLEVLHSQGLALM